jgi:hypothetical protein
LGISKIQASSNLGILDSIQQLVSNLWFFNTNTDIEKSPEIMANLNLSEPTDQFRRFLSLPLEIQNIIWAYVNQQPFIVKLRLDARNCRFFAHPRPAMMVCKHSRKETERYLKTADLVDPPLHLSRMRPNLYAKLSTDVFFLQIPGQRFCEADSRKDEALIPTGLLQWVDPRDNIRVAIPQIPRIWSTNLIESVAVQLSLRPFDFHLGTEDHPGAAWSHDPSSGPTKLGNWALIEIYHFVSGTVEQILRYFPRVEKLYFVVPEKKRGHADTSYYEYNGYQYPKTGEKAFLPWAVASDGELMYSTKVLQTLEQEMHLWTMRHQQMKREGRRYRELDCYPQLPAMEFVIADYEGRVKAVQ